MNSDILAEKQRFHKGRPLDNRDRTAYYNRGFTPEKTIAWVRDPGGRIPADPAWICHMEDQLIAVRTDRTEADGQEADTTISSPGRIGATDER